MNIITSGEFHHKHLNLNGKKLLHQNATFPKTQILVGTLYRGSFPRQVLPRGKYTISYLKDKTLRYPEHVALITAG